MGSAKEHVLCHHTGCALVAEPPHNSLLPGMESCTLSDMEAHHVLQTQRSKPLGMAIKMQAAQLHLFGEQIQSPLSYQSLPHLHQGT